MECLKVVYAGGGGQGEYSSVVEHCGNRHVALGIIPSSTYNTQKKEMGDWRWGSEV